MSGIGNAIGMALLWSRRAGLFDALEEPCERDNERGARRDGLADLVSLVSAGMPAALLLGLVFAQVYVRDALAALDGGRK